MPVCAACTRRVDKGDAMHLRTDPEHRTRPHPTSPPLHMPHTTRPVILFHTPERSESNVDAYLTMFRCFKVPRW